MTRIKSSVVDSKGEIKALRTQLKDIVRQKKELANERKRLAREVAASEKGFARREVELNRLYEVRQRRLDALCPPAEVVE
jgi:predicted nuclease with TOPRIM domain